MIAPRATSALARRVAFAPQPAPLLFSAARIGLTTGLRAPQLRPSSTATTPLTKDDAAALLAAQRLRRPVSPHLEIYKMEQTYFGSSIWTRITGSVFSGGLYVFAVAYLAAPLLGWHLESAVLAQAVGALPVAVKGGAKFLLAWPFVYHSFNGVRHLIWDMGRGYAKASLIKTAWLVWSTSLVSALYLAFGM